MEEKNEFSLQERDYSTQILGIIRSDSTDEEIKSQLQEYHENDIASIFEELEAEEQPGTHVRRVNDRELTDDEMIEYYSGLARRHNGRLTGYYQNGICFVVDEEHIFRSMDRSLSTERFILADTTPYKVRQKGFPLDSLSIDIKTGKYYYDLEEHELAGSTFEGTRMFFEKVMAELPELFEC